MLKEGKTVELKLKVVEDLKKEVIAFANSGGGKIYIGIADNGEVVGVEDPDDSLLQITNMIRDAIKPDITMFVRYDVLEEEGKDILVIEIQSGANRPYYLAKKGLRPEGVYVRQGTSAVPATDTAIRQMIKESDGDSFEEARSLEQDLTFKSVTAEFHKRKIDFGKQQMQTLQLIRPDGMYTNLGLLLSEQCPHTMKVAVFEGTNQNTFKDRQEFSGSLLQQMNEAYAFIDRYNSLGSTFEGLLRIDRRAYPEMAVREALLNSLVHREYSVRASTLISIYDDRIEFVSVGGLLSGISLEDVMMGLSVCRNPLLANVYYRLQLIEAYGTGMQKIMSAYQGSNKLPKIEVTANAFKIVLPNKNSKFSRDMKNAFERREEPYLREEEAEYTVSQRRLHKQLPMEKVEENEERVLSFFAENPLQRITRADIEALLGVSTATAFRLLRRLTEKGQIVKEGAGKNSFYRRK